MVRELSSKQRNILRFIRDFRDDHDYPPSIREIQDGCGISSTSVVDYNLKKLEGQGYIHRDREVSRAIELLDRGGRRPLAVSVPIIGQIAAGQPIPVPAADTWENLDYSESIEVAADMVKGRTNVYGLRVKGTSMIDALVNDGDIVLLEAASTAENGDVVAAWLKREQEATLKRFYLEGGRVRLQPANETMQPIYTDPDNLEVQGRFLGAIRRSP